MKRTDFSAMACSAARTLDIIGEWWTLLIIRDLFLGNRRFSGLQTGLGISKKVLTDRLETLLAEDIVEMKPYGEAGQRHEYHLTQKGRELGPVLLSLMAWGDKWVFEGRVPVELTHKKCGHRTTAVTVCSCCGEPINFGDLSGNPGETMPEKEQQRWHALLRSKEDD